MAFLLPALVALLPLLITPGILFHYDITPKIIILVLITAACLALPGETANGLAELWRRKTGRWLCGLAAAQVVWFGVATSLSSRPLFSLFGSNWRRMGFFTIVASVRFHCPCGGAPGAIPQLIAERAARFRDRDYRRVGLRHSSVLRYRPSAGRCGLPRRSR